MGVEVAFFRASSDAVAAGATARPGRPLGWPVQTGRRRVGLLRSEPVLTELGPAFDAVTARGYDPVVSAATLEELLTGRPYDLVTQDPRWGLPVDEPDDEAVGVVALTDALRDALAAAPSGLLARAAEGWARTEEHSGPGWEDVGPAERLALLERLQGLARRAAHDDDRLYACYAL